MDLTPQEKYLRERYLRERSSDRVAGWVFDAAIFAVSIGAFVSALVRDKGIEALIVVAYALALIGAARYFYGGLVYSKHLRSLIVKYEAALADAKEKA
ncbi:MAG TPA: hypothetical protein VHC20_06230 [Candidatus Paceibacterota bacterium]|nr:hypothetical protein [Candidatus Paceibacterota bacterium]